MSAKARARSVVRRLASPLTKRLYARVDLRAAELHQDIGRNMDAVPGLIDTRTAELGAEIEALNRYLPTVINTIASQNAASREAARQLASGQTRLDGVETDITNLWTDIANQGQAIVELRGRVEFVRREILLEARYGTESLAAPADAVAALPSAEAAGTLPRVVDEQKLRSMAGNLRLNVGAGHIQRADYLNVDVRELPGIDVVADVHDLPFEEEELKEIYSAHLLEHFPVEELRRVILPRWVSLLEDGGKLVSIVPDVETMVAERAADRMPFDDFIEVMYGGQEYAGDFHFSGFSKKTLTHLLEDVGLEDVKVIEEGRRNGACYEMEIEAVRRIATPQ